MNGETVDLKWPSRQAGTSVGCTPMNEQCFYKDRPRCGYHGECVASFARFDRCDCDPMFQGASCRDQ